MPTAFPQMIVIAGPNGAGKTTVAQVLVPESLKIAEFVNADNIAKGLSPFAPDTVAFEAGRLMLHRLRSLIARRTSFAFETTLSGRSQVQLLRDARAAGYSVHLLYVWLHSAELSISRIANRVRHGGHSIPEDIARRRYGRSVHNFFAAYRELAQSWVLCDNSGNSLRLVARRNTSGVTEIMDPRRLRRIQRHVAREHQIR